MDAPPNYTKALMDDFSAPRGRHGVIITDFYFTGVDQPCLLAVGPVLTTFPHRPVSLTMIVKSVTGWESKFIFEGYHTDEVSKQALDVINALRTIK